MRGQVEDVEKKWICAQGKRWGECEKRCEA